MKRIITLRSPKHPREIRSALADLPEAIVDRFLAALGSDWPRCRIEASGSGPARDITDPAFVNRVDVMIDLYGDDGPYWHNHDKNGDTAKAMTEIVKAVVDWLEAGGRPRQARG